MPQVPLEVDQPSIHHSEDADEDDDFVLHRTGELVEETDVSPTLRHWGRFHRKYLWSIHGLLWLILGGQTLLPAYMTVEPPRFPVCEELPESSIPSRRRSLESSDVSDGSMVVPALRWRTYKDAYVDTYEGISGLSGEGVNGVPAVGVLYRESLLRPRSVVSTPHAESYDTQSLRAVASNSADRTVTRRLQPLANARESVLENPLLEGIKTTTTNCDPKVPLPPDDCVTPYSYFFSPVSVVSEFEIPHSSCVKSPFKNVSWTSSAFAVGFLFGVLTMGILADLLGRRSAIALSTLVMQVATIWTAFAPGVVSFGLARLFTGFGVGGGGLASMSLFLETTDRKHRQFVIAAQSAFFSLGVIVASLLATVIPTWRALVLVLALPGFYLLVSLCCSTAFLESPRWQIASGRNTQAYKTFKRISELDGESMPAWVSTENIEYHAYLLDDDLSEWRRQSSGVHGSPQSDFKPVSTLNEHRKSDRLHLVFCVWPLHLWIWALVFLWFATSFLYYGLFLNTEYITEAMETPTVTTNIESPRRLDPNWRAVPRQYPPARFPNNDLPAGNFPAGGLIPSNLHSFARRPDLTWIDNEQAEDMPNEEPLAQNVPDREPPKENVSEKEPPKENPKTKENNPKEGNNPEIAIKGETKSLWQSGKENIKRKWSGLLDLYNSDEVSEMKKIAKDYADSTLTTFTVQFDSSHPLSTYFKKIRRMATVTLTTSCLETLGGFVAVWMAGMQCAGRKGMCLALLFLGGATAIGTALLRFPLTDPSHYYMVAYLVNAVAGLARLFAAGAFTLLYLYSSELFPTTIRNSSLGLLSVVARIAAAVIPPLTYIFEKAYPGSTLALFGILSIMAVTFSFQVLPDTLNRPILDNIIQLQDASRNDPRVAYAVAPCEYCCYDCCTRCCCCCRSSFRYDPASSSISRMKELRRRAKRGLQEGVRAAKNAGSQMQKQLHKLQDVNTPSTRASSMDNPMDAI